MKEARRGGVIVFRFFLPKNAISLFFEGSGNRNIGATLCIGREIWCLLYAGFFLHELCSILAYSWPSLASFTEGF